MLLSIITPLARDADPEHLADAYASLRRQDPGLAWEWLVQLDTATGGPPIPDAIAADARVHVGRNYRGGPAVARTSALARGPGEVVVVLDADDELTDHALTDIHAAFTTDPALGWTTVFSGEGAPSFRSGVNRRNFPDGRVGIAPRS